MSRTGIGLISCASVRIAGNQVINIGPANVTFGPSAGISVTGPPLDRADVTDNIVRRSDSVTQGFDSTRWRALYIGPLTAFTQSALYTGVPVAENRLLLVSNLAAHEVNEGQQLAGVRGNFMEAVSFAALAEVSTTVSCIFTDNHCVVYAPTGVELATAANVGAPSLVVSNNIVSGGYLNLAIDAANPTPYTALGNITGGQILLGGRPLPAPWAPLNL
jgi:hypothetical protein